MRRIACVAAALLLATLFRAGAAPGAAAPGEDSPAPRLNPRCESFASKNLSGMRRLKCGTTHWSSLGKPTGWGGDLSGLHGGLDSGTAWHGAASLRIDLGPGITPVTCFDVWPPARVEQHAPLAAKRGLDGCRGRPAAHAVGLDARQRPRDEGAGSVSFRRERPETRQQAGTNSPCQTSGPAIRSRKLRWTKTSAWPSAPI
jgi:hypothetical protein